ncbi:MAG: proton-conducting transporter membrane subunit [Proteobacteria bacterium]|nr:proton-conducting transporter membrane subunit [Pseudomonadota bacterium]
MALLLILIPLASIILLNIGFKNAMTKLAIWLSLAVSAWQVAMIIFKVGFDSLNLVNVFNLEIDGLSSVLLLSIGIVAFCSILVGNGTICCPKKKFNFYNLILLSIIGMNGIVMVRDLFSMYVFLEITAVSAFILIAYQEDKFSMEGSFKYLVLSAVATVMMLSSIAILLMYAGNTSFVMVRDAVQGMNSPLVLTAIALFVVGLLIKGGLVPFHGWLPDAYTSAPASVSAFIAGIVTKTTGIYTMIRIVSEVFGFSETIKMILMIVGLISIFVGALAALGQNDFKRMLAYSSISQVGYIILSLGTGTALGVAGAVFHLFNHSIFKTQLFINSAAVEKQTGTRDMDSMSGLSNVMPVTGWTSVVAFLSTAGIPPLSGFWSKLIIVIALWKAGYYWFAGLAIIGSLITLAYFLYMQRRVFFGKINVNFKDIKEAGASIIIPAIILAAITLGVGIFFPYFINTIIVPVSSVF